MEIIETKKDNWIMGLWKFSDKIPIKELQQVAEEWAKDPNYIQIYIRPVSSNQRAIGFTYQFPEGVNLGDALLGNALFMIDEIYRGLKQKFGNDNVKYEISKSVYLIK